MEKNPISIRLMIEFLDHLRELGVRKLNTLVDKNETQLINFFDSHRFRPSKNIVNLERDL